MNRTTRVLRNAVALILVLIGTSCGGGNPPGGSSSSTTGTVAAASNVVPVVVNGGPTATSPTVNTLYTTVTICVPGSTTQCQTIDNVQVDTGSYGFRVLASVLTLALPITLAPNGNSLVECTQFVDGYSWGPVASADIQVSGEAASSVPIQVIGDASFSVVPDACSSTGPAEDTVATFGANGILGIGVFEQDCGSACVSDPTIGDYYACTPAGDCVGTVAPLTSQVLNPVPLFPVDNNGTFIELPGIASPGEATLTGSLIFGIDTESNNASGTQSVLTVDPNEGTFTTVFNGQTLDASFIDSGTNGIFFNDSSIPVCTDQSFANFYCPTSTDSLSGTLTGLNGVSATADFQVGNAETIATDNPTFLVLPSLAGTYSAATDTFDWGLPFYYGRSVATAIEGHSTAVNTGPYIAF
jgi:hypothetical protein